MAGREDEGDGGTESLCFQYKRHPSTGDDENLVGLGSISAYRLVSAVVYRLAALGLDLAADGHGIYFSCMNKWIKIAKTINKS